MRTYFYKQCPKCGAGPGLLMNVPTEERDAQVCDCGEPMVRNVAAQYESQQWRRPLWWHHVASDWEPKEIQGAAPFSKEKMEYATRTYGKGGRWI